MPFKYIFVETKMTHIKRSYTKKKGLISKHLFLRRTNQLTGNRFFYHRYPIKSSERLTSCQHDDNDVPNTIKIDQR